MSAAWLALLGFCRTSTDYTPRRSGPSPPRAQAGGCAARGRTQTIRPQDHSHDLCRAGRWTMRATNWRTPGRLVPPSAARPRCEWGFVWGTTSVRPHEGRRSAHFQRNATAAGCQNCVQASLGQAQIDQGDRWQDDAKGTTESQLFWTWFTSQPYGLPQRNARRSTSSVPGRD